MSLEVVEATPQFVVISKPAGLPSVPTRVDPAAPNVASEIARQFPDGEGPLIVHRLDMETSGLMVVALTRAAHRTLSRQFMKRKVGKSYEAVLEADVAREEGSIDLPLRVDWPNRPRQRVDFAEGRPARTLYRVLDRAAGRTRVSFRPLTGRSHQLRVHASTPRCDACLTPTDDYASKVHRCGWPARGGLGAPILGDSLYSFNSAAKRLHLHATSLSFFHPDTGQWLTFDSAAPF